MRVVLKNLFLFLCLSFSFSCSSHMHGTTLPFDSFVLIKSVSIDNNCLGLSNCFIKSSHSYSSGSIVYSDKKNHEWSYILTTGHSCGDGGPNDRYLVNDQDGKKHRAKVVLIDNDIDICLLKTRYMRQKPLQLAYEAPKKGEKLYNLNAAAAIWSSGGTMLLEGVYSGIYDEKDKSYVYTIPAYPGSSGSPILNQFGKLVGMIHSVHGRFNNISFGTSLQQTSDFIKKAIKKDQENPIILD
jgi:S1-C subfamily serine protease